MLILIRYFLTIILCTVAAYYDSQTNRIPNFLTFGFMLIGLLLSTSLHEFLMKLLALIFLFFLGILNIMGMGDLKLWMALSTLLGLVNSSYCIGIGAILLIVHGFIIDRKESFNTIKLMFTTLYYTRRIIQFEQKKYAFAPYILVGTLLYIGLTNFKVVMF